MSNWVYAKTNTEIFKYLKFLIYNISFEILWKSIFDNIYFKFIYFSINYLSAKFLKLIKISYLISIISFYKTYDKLLTVGCFSNKSYPTYPAYLSHFRKSTQHQFLGIYHAVRLSCHSDLIHCICGKVLQNNLGKKRKRKIK